MTVDPEEVRDFVKITVDTAASEIAELTRPKREVSSILEFWPIEFWADIFGTNSPVLSGHVAPPLYSGSDSEELSPFQWGHVRFEETGVEPRKFLSFRREDLEYTEVQDPSFAGANAKQSS